MSTVETLVVLQISNSCQQFPPFIISTGIPYKNPAAAGTAAATAAEVMSDVSGDVSIGREAEAAGRNGDGESVAARHGGRGGGVSEENLVLFESTIFPVFYH